MVACCPRRRARRAACSTCSRTAGGKAKGEATIKLKLELEGDAFRIQGDVKVKAPDLPRRRSILWQDGGSFTRFPPNQTQMFGSAPVRRI
jgi:hypothetical protein